MSEEQEPRYLVVGGEPFDRMADAPPEAQSDFLTILHEIRRSPRKSDKIEIVAAREMGEENRYIATRHGVNVNYAVLDHQPSSYILLIEVVSINDELNPLDK